MRDGTKIGSRGLEATSSSTGVTVDELALLQRVAKRDEAAFELLYRAYYPRLFSYLFRLLRRLDAVEETLNDVMMVVWNSAATFQQRSRVSTWILGIAYRQALKSRRRERRQPDLLPPESIESWKSLGPEEAEEREWNLALSAAMERLSPAHRAVVELTYHYGYSYREIGEIVDCPTNTVKTRMFHARRHLQRELRERVARRQEG